jgi:hypothetical protein
LPVGTEILIDKTLMELGKLPGRVQQLGAELALWKFIPVQQMRRR